MGARSSTMTIRYDKVGDILHVDFVAPYAEQESDELDDLIVVRSNPRTNVVENVEILFFSRRFEESDHIDLPLAGEARILAP